LEKPVRITEQVWPEETVPVVSIWCITYNHADFIRDAIEGFLMQETTFPVEIFIHDDASTDGTADIVREYAERYPQLFWIVLQKENQWSKGTGHILNTLKQQRGEFVAFCEGDDFWTDENKLELQINAIRHTQSCVGSCHITREFDAANQCLRLLGDKSKPYLDMSDVIGTLVPWHTSSFVGRKDILELLEPWITSVLSGDFVIFAKHASLGLIASIPRVMSAYRNHSGGVSKDPYWVNKYHEERVRLWSLIDQNIPHGHPDLIQSVIRHHAEAQLGAKCNCFTNSVTALLRRARTMWVNS
jgi:glycosyltransferase involved in cell wall biosynthesis